MLSRRCCWELEEIFQIVGSCGAGTPMRVPHLEKQDPRCPRQGAASLLHQPDEGTTVSLENPSHRLLARLEPAVLGVQPGWAPGGHRHRSHNPSGCCWPGQGRSAELPPTLPHTMSPLIQPRASRHPAQPPSTHGGKASGLRPGKGAQQERRRRRRKSNALGSLQG